MKHKDEARADVQVKHMVERFLQWKLPENFNPDGGIVFKRDYTAAGHAMKHEPVGTNLLDYTQAEQMVRYMIEGLPPAPASSPDRAEELAREAWKIVAADLAGEAFANDIDDDDEACLAKVAALLRSRMAERWESMETAPRDGTRILGNFGQLVSGAPEAGRREDGSEHDKT